MVYVEESDFLKGLILIAWLHAVITFEVSIFATNISAASWILKIIFANTNNI
jgi:hypothetical protein